MISNETLSKAVKASILLESKKKKSDDALVEPVITKIRLIFTAKVIPSSKKVSPITIPIKNTFRTNASVCVITKDPQSDYKHAILDDVSLGRVSKVMGVSKLSKKHSTYMLKRQLSKSYDLFLADERVVTLLPKLLGKAFFKTKRIPVPVDMTKKARWSERINKAIDSTYYFQSTGSCTNVVIGNVSMTKEQLIENAKDVIDFVQRKILVKGIACVDMQADNCLSIPLM